MRPNRAWPISGSSSLGAGWACTTLSTTERVNSPTPIRFQLRNWTFVRSRLPSSSCVNAPDPWSAAAEVVLDAVPVLDGVVLDGVVLDATALPVAPAAELVG